MSDEGAKPFVERLIVKISDEEPDEGPESTFYSDEEPHFLTPEQGFGFNPLNLGDHVKSGGNATRRSRDYEIVRKLGFGVGSSVWLVKCTEDPTLDKHFFALKVLTVNLTAGLVKHKYWELSSARRVASTNTNHPGYQHCAQLRDTLVCQSYHGPHMSLVFDVLGSDMLSLRRRQPNRVFSASVAKRITKHVLLALDYMHTECGLVHRDVKPENVMVSLDVPDETIAEYLEKNPAALYEPQIELRLSRDPIVTVKSQPLPDIGLDPSLDNLTVKLGDYGEAIAIEDIAENCEDECQPILLRAPEVTLGYHSWSTAIDIWSVGCLVFEYLTGAPMFELYESPSVTVHDSHLQRMIEHLGAFPPGFLEKCGNRDRFFNEKGELLRIEKFFPRTVEQCMAHYEHVEPGEIAPAAAFIRRCLTLDPAVRPKASELLEDEWLAGV